MIREYSLELKGAMRLPSLVCHKEVEYSSKANKSSLIVKMLCDVFRIDKNIEEKVYMVCLDSAMNITSVFLIASGGYNQSLVDLKSIYTRILLSGANTSFLIAHNHPSGSINPSLEDRQLNRRLYESSKIMGVRYVDFIVIGDKKIYYSFADKEVLSE